MPDNVSRDELRDALIAAYTAGATDVHNNYQPDPDPSFYEAASDYASDRLAAIATQPASDGWRGIETAVRDCVTEVDLWCTSDDGDGWLIRGILMIGTPDWIKRDDQSDYFPHENGGWLTHWRPLPAPPNAPPLSPGEPTDITAIVESHAYMQDIAIGMGYPSVLEALEALSEFRESLSPGASSRPTREEVAALVYAWSPVEDQNTDLDGRPTSKPFNVPWSAIAECYPDIYDSAMEVADRLIALFERRG